MDTITITDTGCYLDSHRGHYAMPAIIELATGWGYIIGPFEQFALAMYDRLNHDEEFPHEGLIELADSALKWLNSGQSECVKCDGKGYMPVGYASSDTWVDKDGKLRCRICTGTGRGDRIEGQNFPPIIPDGFRWDWYEGDFGLYPTVLFNIWDADERKQVVIEADMKEAREWLSRNSVSEDQINRFLAQSSEDIPLQIAGYTVEAIDPQY